MKSVKYLLALQESTGANDAALARLLNLSGPAISHYKTGKRIMDDETCLAVAMQLNVDPMHVVGAACIDRAEKSGYSSLWKVFMEKAAATAATAVLATGVNLFLTPHNAEASTYSPHSPAASSCLYIMSNWFRKIATRLRAKLARFERLTMPTAPQPAAS